jgi:hypothetical protein
MPNDLRLERALAHPRFAKQADSDPALVHAVQLLGQEPDLVLAPDQLDALDGAHTSKHPSDQASRLLPHPGIPRRDRQRPPGGVRDQHGTVLRPQPMQYGAYVRGKLRIVGRSTSPTAT